MQRLRLELFRPPKRGLSPLCSILQCLHIPLDNAHSTHPDQRGKLHVDHFVERTVEIEARCIPVYMNRTQVIIDSVPFVKPSSPRFCLSIHVENVLSSPAHAQGNTKLPRSVYDGTGTGMVEAASSKSGK